MDLFILKLILSFIVGGVWVTLSTILAEKYGSKIGGIIAGLPSTILVALFFIGWTQSTTAAVEATILVPLVGGIICLFLVSYLFLAPRINFWLALLISTGFWFVLALGAYFLGFRNFWISFLIYLGLTALSYLVAEKLLKINSEGKRKIKYTQKNILFRSGISGGIIAFAVLISKLLDPVLGGIFAMFPAAFISTILIIYFHHGKTFSFPIMKVAILSGMSVVSFGLFARYTYLPLGLWQGTLISLILAWGVGYTIHLFVKKRTN